MRILLIATTIALMQAAMAQDIHFRNSDQKIRVVKGNTVVIDADTAFIISQSRAAVLNEKLTELEQIRSVNESLKLNNRELLERIRSIEDLVSKLISRMEEGQTGTALDLNSVITELDSHLGKLRENNDQLSKNNNDLERQLTQMDQTINKLKKDIRGIWWNGVADKLIVGISCLAIGYVMASL